MSFKPFAVPGINFLRPVRILKTESFRSAALFATLFLILSWVLLGAVYWIVNETQTAALVGAVICFAIHRLNTARLAAHPELREAQ